MIYLFRRPPNRPDLRNSQQLHAGIAAGADAAAARAALRAAAPSGEVRVDEWEAIPLSDDAALASGDSAVLFTGDAVVLGPDRAERFRGQ